MTMQVEWHLRLIIESSAVDRAKELAKSERRSISNYVAALIERAQQQQQAQRPE
jgi:F0F1-type ATP synthase membrane subunit b/b'